MIKKHDFNSEWLNCKAGIITDLNFFSLNKEQKQHSLAPYHFVELRTAQNVSEKLKHIYETGFYQVDTQIKFTLELSKIMVAANTEHLTFQRASETPFLITPEDFFPFKNERFLILPHITQEMVDRRYIQMMNILLSTHPNYCLQIMDGDHVQGWYFGKPNGQGIDLSLAMLHKNAHIRGSQLYRKALSIYAKEFAVGTERFSIKNVPVHNILSKLGARFLEPELVWFWLNNSD